MKVKLNLGSIIITNKIFIGNNNHAELKDCYIETEFNTDEYKEYLGVTKEICTELFGLGKLFLPTILEALKEESVAKSKYWNKKAEKLNESP